MDTNKKETKQISNAERIAYFNQLTRQNFKPTATKTGSEGQELAFDLYKVRLLGKISIRVVATLTATHATETTFIPHADAPFNFIKKVALSMNNGVDPISLSGKSLKPLMASLNGVSAVTSHTSGRYPVVMPLTASSTGAANRISFNVELPQYINPKDPIGLILLQADDVLATVKVTLGSVSDIAPTATGFTFALSNISVTLNTETFSIPSIPEAMPDIYTAHMFQERVDTVIQGENIFRLPVGLIYRKIGFILYDTNGARLTGADQTIITSTIDIVENQAETPYQFFAEDLAKINCANYDGPLDTGTFIIDLSSQGIKNGGGARDYIDTTRVTEFWLRFTAGQAGTVRIFYETLSLMR